MKTFVAAAAVAVAVLGWWSTPAGAESASTTETASAAELVARINDLRSRQGQRPLAVDDELTAKATGWGHTMAAAGRIWHSTLPDGITAEWAALGENVGAGGTVGALHQAFVQSPRHYENLVRPDFDRVGVGVARVGQVLYAAQVFMKLQPAVSPSVAPAYAPVVTPPSGEAVTPAAAPTLRPRRSSRPTRISPPSAPRNGGATRHPRPRPTAVAPPSGAVPSTPSPAAPPLAVPAPPVVDLGPPSVELTGHTTMASTSPVRPVATVAAVAGWLGVTVGLAVVRRWRRTTARRRVSDRELRRLVGQLPGA